MKLKIYLLSLLLVVAVVGAPQSVAATSALSMSIRQTPSASETLLTLYGNLRPNRSGTTVKIQVDTDGKWTTTRFTTKVTKVGTWKVTALATALNAKVRYRAVSVSRVRVCTPPFVRLPSSNNQRFQMLILLNL